jgi:hypothetical protein
MSKENFNKLIQSAKHIKLSQEKKDFIRARVENFMDYNPITRTTSSPFSVPKISVFNFSKAISFALIILVASGGTISYASENTLPGDTLYTVKVNVKEPLEQKLAITPEAKLGVKTKQVEKRLTEAQTLLEKNDTSPEKHKEVEVRVTKQVEEISETITLLQEKGDVETILATTSKLQPVLKAHQEALQEVAHSEDTKIALSKNSSEPEKEIETNSFALTENEIETDENILAIGTTSTTTTVSEDISKSSLADTLLKTVEKTLLQVEEQETKALESVSELEVNETTKDLITSVTDKKVEEATKEIDQIKNEITEAQNALISPTENKVDQSLEEILASEAEMLETTAKQDATLLTVADAELLLLESKKLFEQGLYKESLEKAQEAIKITATIEANKNIEAAKEAVNTLEVTKQEELTTPEKTTPLENQIKIEDQASQAIQSLENSLNFKQDKNAQ